MQIAFSTHAARAYPRPRWGGAPRRKERAALFDWVASEGFAGVEVADSWFDFDLLDDDAAREIRGTLQERSLATAALNCLRKTLCRPEYAGRHAAQLDRAITIASLLDCPIVSISLSVPSVVPGASAVLGTTDSPGGSREASERDYADTAARLRPLARRAGELGITLSIELHHCSIADTSTGVLRVIAETGEANMGANPDLVNEYWSYAQPPEPWREALEALAPVTNVWHVKNVQRVYIPEVNRAVFLERSLDQGDIDYRWAAGIMQRVGFAGWICIENAGPTDPFATTAHGRRYLERVVRSPNLGLL